MRRRSAWMSSSDILEGSTIDGRGSYTSAPHLASLLHTVIRFVSTRAKFGICTVVGLNETLVKDEMRTFYSDCEHFSFNRCFI
jgi:hypothetical protein